MSFLKSCIAVLTVFSLHACTGKVTQTPGEEQAAAALTPTALKATAVKTLPSFMVQDAAGNKLDIQRFKGKKILVNLWATWCPPCRAEMPSLDKLYRTVDTGHVQFVMLTLDNDFETAKKFVQKKDFSAPIFYPAGDMPELFTVDGIPTTFIFNESGELIAQHEGAEDYNTAEYRTLFGAAK